MNFNSSPYTDSEAVSPVEVITCAGLPKPVDLGKEV